MLRLPKPEKAMNNNETTTTYEIRLAEIEERIGNGELDLARELMSKITLADMLNNLSIERATEDDARNAVEKSRYHLNLAGFLAALALPVHAEHIQLVDIQKSPKMTETEAGALLDDSIPEELINIIEGFLCGLGRRIQLIQTNVIPDPTTASRVTH
jgi:hypothetical protein